MPIRELDQWNVETLRLTVFPVVGHEIDHRALFEEVAGRQEDEMQANRATGQTVLRATLEPGPFIIEFKIQPDRFHWSMLPVGLGPPSEALPPSLGPYPELLEQFYPIVDRWLNNESIPEIVRIAYGIILELPVESIVDGYDLLTRYIPTLNIDSQNISDLIYQINRRRTLLQNVPGLGVNRLTNWAVITSQFASIQLDPIAINEIRGDQIFAVRLVLDINTDQANQDPLPRETNYAIFGELAELGAEIVSEGDIP